MRLVKKLVEIGFSEKKKMENKNIYSIDCFINRVNFSKFAKSTLEAIENAFKTFDEEEQKFNKEQAEIVEILLKDILPYLISDKTLMARHDEENNKIEVDFHDRSLRIQACEHDLFINEIADIRMKPDGKAITKTQRYKIREDNERDIIKSTKILFYSSLHTNNINLLDLPIFKPLVIETVAMDF